MVERDRIADTLRLAERLGGVAVTLPGRGRIADDVIDYARSNNVAQIVIGKSSRTQWFELLHGSVVHDLVRSAGDLSVHVIAGEALKEEAIPRKNVRTSPGSGADVAGYFAGAWATAAGTLSAELLKPYFGGETVPLIFMMGILGVAYLFGLGPSILAAVASMLCYNFFFIPPIYSFTIADPINVAALFFFLFTALIVSNLTARVRNQAELAGNRAAITSALYGFSSNLASQAKLEDLVSTSVSQIAASLGADVVLMLPDTQGRLKIASSFPPGDVMEKADWGAAQWSFEHGRSAGRGSDTLPGALRVFLPLRTSRGVIGVVGLEAGRRADIILTPDERRLLDALMDQAAVAIERVRLAKEMDDARVAAEAERLRGALLTSLSHDLKTPLASILGAANSLREYGERFDAKARAEMIGTIEEEASRMARFVGNLLDMTKLEVGRCRAQAPADGSVGCYRNRAAPDRGAACGFQGQPRCRAGPAAPGAGRHAHRAGAGQSPGQRRKICSAVVHHHDHGPKDGRRGPPSNYGRGVGHPRGSAVIDLREIPSCEKPRSSTGGHRPRARHLPWLRRSDGRRDHGRQQDRSIRRSVHG